jgi:predicted SAM-dependent methyltransferase
MIKQLIKKGIKLLDDRLGTSLCEKSSAFSNRIRRPIHFFAAKWKCRIGITDKNPIRLHLGCGGKHFNGHVNIDYRKTDATDLVCDITRLPYRDSSVELIECYHVIEHLPVCLMANIGPTWGEKYSSLIMILKEWNRVLKPNGKLIIEAPDFDQLIEEYMNAGEDRREELLVYIYGGYRFNSIHDIHRWGVNKTRLKYILEKANFKDITFKEAQDYHKELSPCLRAEATK